MNCLSDWSPVSSLFDRLDDEMSSHNLGKALCLFCFFAVISYESRADDAVFVNVQSARICSGEVIQITGVGYVEICNSGHSRETILFYLSKYKKDVYDKIDNSPDRKIWMEIRCSGLEFKYNGSLHCCIGECEQAYEQANAECIFDNIQNATTDKAVLLLRRTCRETAKNQVGSLLCLPHECANRGGAK